jgi:hypothetical protein
MYIIEKFVELGLEEGEEWKSPLHRQVAVDCLIQNPRVFTAEKLRRNVKIINSIPEDKMQKLSVGDLLDMGCDF